MAAIINSGRAKIAFQQGNNLPLNITQFVFANIDGLDTSADVDLTQGMPSADDIVYQADVDQHGYVTPDQVVYSIVVGPDIGDFNFNWVGLIDEDETLIAVSYTPVQIKFKTVGLNIGNTLTRNFLTKYNNAQAITGITVAAEVWQLDFMGRLNDADEHLRQDMEDIFGAGFFIDTGFSAVTDGAAVTVKNGVGYVGGLRVVLPVDQAVSTAVLPIDIYVDASLIAGPSDSTVVTNIVTSPPSAPLTNYTDGSGVAHYITKIASVSGTFDITDYRNSLPDSDSILKAVLDLIAGKASLDSPNFFGTPTVPDQSITDSSGKAANTKFVKDAVKLFGSELHVVFSGSTKTFDISSYTPGFYIALGVDDDGYWADFFMFYHGDNNIDLSIPRFFDYHTMVTVNIAAGIVTASYYDSLTSTTTDLNFYSIYRIQ